MKATLDHNVIIDLIEGAPRVERLRDAISTGRCFPYVTEIGASEMRQRGVRPDRFDLFECLLKEAGLSQARRLHPMCIPNVTFWDHCLGGNREMASKSKEIERILFSNAKPLSPPTEVDDCSHDAKVWLNRVCDVQTMWCHLKSDCEVFISSDSNFTTKKKLPKLLALGARKIATPEGYDS